MTTRAEAIAAAGACIAEAIRLRDTLRVEEAARIAYTPTGPSIEELERRIRARRQTSRPASTPPRAPGGDRSTAGPASGVGAGRGATTRTRNTA